MVVKERHFQRIDALIPRYKGDLSQSDFNRHLERTFDALTLLEPLGVSRPETLSLIPSADGEIKRILLTIPQYAVSELIMASAYRSLLKALPQGLELVILVQASAEQTVREWLDKTGHLGHAEISTFENSLNISIWAEDGYVVARDQASGNTYFVEPYSFPRYADGLVANFVTNFTNLRDTRAPLYFQGGNVLIGDDFFLIGADYPANTLAYIKSGVLRPPEGVTPQAFVKQLYAEYLDKKRAIFYVGSSVPVPTEQTRQVTINGETWEETICAGNHAGTVQPLFHIDMFITPVGRAANGKYRLLVGDPSKAYAILREALPAHAMQPVFDNIAAQLQQVGFEVQRNPLPLVYLDDTLAKQRRWYFATANNALVQNAPTKRVWLPTYGHGAWAELEATDKANKALWESLGFAVDMLADFHPFAENLGAVHCIKKYLARG
jgi:hypothetical protein